MIETCHIDDLQIHGGGNGYGLKNWQMKRVVRTDKVARSRAHGSLDNTKFYDGVQFTLVGVIEVSDPLDLEPALDTLKQRCALGSDHTLKFQRRGISGEEQATVRVSDDVDAPQQPENSLFQPFTLALFSADPRVYSVVETSGHYDPTTATAAFTMASPLDSPITLPSTDTGLLAVQAGGNFPTPPTFVVTGPVGAPGDPISIDWIEGGKSIVFLDSFTLAAGHHVAVDVANRKVTLDGTTERPDVIDAAATSWFELPGNATSTLRLRGGSEAAGQTDLSVTFRDARI